MTANKVNFDIIQHLEGFHTKGYVPPKGKTDKSGVTIGAGFDLGQHVEKDLINMGFDKDLIAKLKPYLDKKGQAARNALAAAPLTVTKPVASKITELVKKAKIQETADWFNKNNKIGKTFEELSPELQTTIASVKFQYGIKQTPNFNQQVLEGRWMDMLDNLAEFGDDFRTRRHKEFLVASNSAEVQEFLSAGAELPELKNTTPLFKNDKGIVESLIAKVSPPKVRQPTFAERISTFSEEAKGVLLSAIAKDPVNPEPELDTSNGYTASENFLIQKLKGLKKPSKASKNE